MPVCRTMPIGKRSSQQGRNRNMRFSRYLAVVIALMLPSAAWGQSAVLQGGPWNPGHIPQYVGQGNSQPIVQDGGPAGGGAVGVNPGEIGVTARGTGTAPFVGQGSGPFGTNICDYDAPTTNATGYHYFCFSSNAQGGGLIAYGAGGVASSLPLAFNINGTVYQFPFTATGIVGPATTVIGDLAVWNNTTGTLLKDVSQVTLAQLPTLGANTALGSIAGGTPIALTTTQFTTLCNIFSTSLSGCVPGSGGGTANFLRADGAWAAPPPPSTTTITIGTTTITSGTPNGLLYDNGGVVGNLASGNSGVLITSAGGLPSISSTLPSAVQNNITATGVLTSGAIGSGFTAITGANIATNTVVNSNLAQMPATTTKCNPTGSTANAQDCSAAQLQSNFPGVPFNTLNAQTSNYTIQTTDCGKTIQAGTGSTGYFIITLPTVSGFAANCNVVVKNADTARAKALSGFPADLATLVGSSPAIYWLGPLQATEVEIVNGSWVTKSNPGRYLLSTTLNLYVDSTSGKDDGTTDGMVSGSAFLTYSHAYAFAQQMIDRGNCNVINANVVQATATLSVGNTMSGDLVPTCSETAFTILGSAPGSNTIQSTTTAVALFLATNNAKFTVKNVTVASSGSGSGWCFLVSGGIIGIDTVWHNTCTSAFVDVSGPESIVIGHGGGSTILGAAVDNIVFIAEDHGQINWAVPFTVSGSPSWTTAFVQSDLGGMNDWTGATITKGAETGKRYAALQTGIVFTSGGGTAGTFFPGNSAGSTDSKSYYDNPAATTVSSCGSGPGSVTGTDYFGHVTEGSTSTGCTIVFAQAFSNAPECTVSVSSSTAQAGLVITSISTSQMVVTHPSVSTPVLRWNCSGQG